MILARRRGARWSPNELFSIHHRLFSVIWLTPWVETATSATFGRDAAVLQAVFCWFCSSICLANVSNSSARKRARKKANAAHRGSRRASSLVSSTTSTGSEGIRVCSSATNAGPPMPDRWCPVTTRQGFWQTPVAPPAERFRRIVRLAHISGISAPESTCAHLLEAGRLPPIELSPYPPSPHAPPHQPCMSIYLLSLSVR